MARTLALSFSIFSAAACIALALFNARRLPGRMAMHQVMFCRAFGRLCAPWYTLKAAGLASQSWPGYVRKECKRECDP